MELIYRDQLDVDTEKGLGNEVIVRSGVQNLAECEKVMNSIKWLRMMDGKHMI